MPATRREAKKFELYPIAGLAICQGEAGGSVARDRRMLAEALVAPQAEVE